MKLKKNKTGEPAKYELALKLASQNKPDLTRVAELLERAHKSNDARATYALATWHLFGHAGYSKNINTAVRLLKIAAASDIPTAHFDLAVCYETGQGIKKSENMAYRHYLAAALNGDNGSIFEVGRCLFYGLGVKRDRKTAEVWFRRVESLGFKVES